MNGLKRIHIGGAFGRHLGRTEWNLAVESPAEALRAIDVNTKGKVREYLSGKGKDRYYTIALGTKKNALDKEEVGRPSGQNDIYILPAVKGRNSGAGKIIAGVALLALAIFQPAFASTAVSYIGGFGGVGLLGASLVLGGISQLLAPTPNFNQNSEGDSRGSDVFGGNASTISQGGAVGLVYGRMLVTPMPISISFQAVDQAIANSFAAGTYRVQYGPGGVVNYIPIAPAQPDNLPDD